MLWTSWGFDGPNILSGLDRSFRCFLQNLGQNKKFEVRRIRKAWCFRSLDDPLNNNVVSWQLCGTSRLIQKSIKIRPQQRQQIDADLHLRTFSPSFGGWQFQPPKYSLGDHPSQRESGWTSDFPKFAEQCLQDDSSMMCSRYFHYFPGLPPFNRFESTSLPSPKWPCAYPLK